jgi:ATP-binding cassette subfamily B protein
MILNNINIKLEKGKTYALVGPTGGGKSTLASLLSRLYDTSEGEVLLEDRDIRAYDSEDLTNKIGFILQDPFMFTGTIKDNIIYGNTELRKISSEDLLILLKKLELDVFLERFPDGLETMVGNSADTISLGQRQLVAFIRAILRKPELLILDEATANVDTVTEKALQTIISKLPESTTKVVIAHRLSTIEKADQIFFIANGKVEMPLDFSQAVNLIENQKRNS